MAQSPIVGILSKRSIPFVPWTGVFLCLMLMACGSGGGDAEIASIPPSFTLSGTVTAPANTVVDWDVNDTNASNFNGSNNGLADPQPLNNPVRLAGHVKLAGDISDFFSVSLSEDETIVLYIADSENADIDLHLYNDRGELLNSAMGDNSVEFLKITNGADYIIEVRIVNAGADIPFDAQASNYSLIIGSAVAVEGSRGMRLSDNFVPGEAIVRFADETLSTTDTKPERSGQKALALGMTLVGGTAGRSMRMQFDTQAEVAAVYNSLGIDDGKLKRSAAMADPKLRSKKRTLEVIKALRQREDVLYAEPNYIRKSFAVPDDTYFNLQWHFNQIHLPEAWDVTNGSAGVIVAVVDSGVLINHPELASKLTGTGYDFVSDADMSGDGDGIDNNPDDPGDHANADNSSTFHGTHVAGIVAAATGNGTGVAGAGWLTRVMVIRGLGLNGEGTDYDISQGIRYAAGLDNDSGRLPDNPADIINLSLGGDEESEQLSNAIQDARDQGVIIIAAAGNQSSEAPTYPAAYETVVSVSAVNYAADLAYYSNYGATIDVAAPGGDASTDLNSDGFGDGVLSTLGGDGSGTIEMGYGFYQGTSMAAPHVAGVVALMKALRPGMTPDDLDALLVGGEITTDIGDSNFFGAGLIDAQKAMLAAQAGAHPTLLSVNPSLVSLGTALSGATITAEKIGDTASDLSVIDVSADVPWLAITPEAVDSDGLGTYTVTGDRSGLADGGYHGTITLVSSENTVTVSVTMIVETTSSSADAGYHYVYLVDAATGATVYKVGVQARDGVYDFIITNVTQGDYFLYAGTDLDLDNRIGDAGEVAGAYLSLNQPRKITVDRDLSGLDFVSEFNIQIN